MAGDKAIVITRHRDGSAPAPLLNADILTAWRTMLADPAERNAVADLLQVDPASLDPESPPFAAEQDAAGLTGGEILIAFAGAFALGFAKELGGQVGKEAARRLLALWRDHVAPRVSPPGSGKLGDEVPPDGE